jgi:hypothetical protein
VILHARITADCGLQQRRETRTILDADAAIRELGRTGAEARLVNLSAEGFMARTDAAIAPGSRVWLTLPGFGRINALVVWAKDGKLGGRFAEPIDPLAAFHAAGLAQ